MRNWVLGAFEEIVLITVAILGKEAYGVAIKIELERHIERKPSIGALHSALYSLEDKGFIESREGGATAERGGRRKKYYEITAMGKDALLEIQEIRNNMLKLVPGIQI